MTSSLSSFSMNLEDRRKYSFHALNSSSSSSSSSPSSFSSYWAQFKPAAIPLLESGKYLAKSGELLIDGTNLWEEITTVPIFSFPWSSKPVDDSKQSQHPNPPQLSTYISSMGASIRTAGDCIAHAAALLRFKTGHEVVANELRDASDCFMTRRIQVSSSSSSAVTATGLNTVQDRMVNMEKKNNPNNQNDGAIAQAKEAFEELENYIWKMNDTKIKPQDVEMRRLQETKDAMGKIISIFEFLAIHLEDIGKAILNKAPSKYIGFSMLQCSIQLEQLSKVVPFLFLSNGNPQNENDKKKKIREAQECQQIVLMAANEMQKAGFSLGAELAEEL